MDGPSPNTLMQFRPTIRHKQAARFQQIAMNIAAPGHEDYGKHLQKNEIKALLRPSASTTQAVLSRLKPQGIPDHDIADNAD